MFDLFKKKEPKKEESKPEIKKDIRPIVTNLAELHKLCLPVEKGENIKEIIQTLKDTLITKGGFGLSANQIAIQKKISYIRIPKKINKDKTIEYFELIVINPKIIEKDRPIKVMNEGCLSFPGVFIHTRRYVFITVEYLNEKLEPKIATFQDVESIALQHEIQHLQGRTMFDSKWRAK